MTLETFPWDSAELLEKPEDVAAYIEAAFEDGEPAVITHALGVVARAKGLSEVANEAGLSLQELREALSPDGDPRLSSLLSLLRALGIKMLARAA